VTSRPSTKGTVTVTLAPWLQVRLFIIQCWVPSGGPWPGGPGTRRRIVLSGLRLCRRPKLRPREPAPLAAGAPFFSANLNFELQARLRAPSGCPRALEPPSRRDSCQWPPKSRQWPSPPIKALQVSNSPGPESGTLPRPGARRRFSSLGAARARAGGLRPALAAGSDTDLRFPKIRRKAGA
jgi:hypothetical protein